MALILLVLILAILFGGLGFILHALWWVAAIVLVVWLVGFAVRALAEGTPLGVSLVAAPSPRHKPSARPVGASCDPGADGATLLAPNANRLTADRSPLNPGEWRLRTKVGRVTCCWGLAAFMVRGNGPAYLVEQKPCR